MARHLLGILRQAFVASGRVPVHFAIAPNKVHERQSDSATMSAQWVMVPVDSLHPPVKTVVRHLAVFLTAIVLLLIGSPTFAKAETSDESKIKDMIAEFATAWHKTDAQALSMFWTPDGDFINPNGMVMNGRVEIQGFYAQAFAMGYAGTTASATVSKIKFLSSTMALVDGTFEISGRTGDNGESIPPESGRYSVILVKKSGRWWILANREMEPLKTAK